MGELSDIYLMMDTILLCCVFLSFRKKFREIYDLDAANFVSLPNLAFNCFLKKSKVELELLIESDQLLFIEKSLYG